MKKRILICGDSWSRSWNKPDFVSNTFLNRKIFTPDSLGYFVNFSERCGEFRNNSFQTAHLTLQSLGFDVVDLSEPGSSNYSQIDRLRTYSMEYDNNFDYIILFHTTPCRDISAARLAQKSDSKIPYKPVPYGEGAIIEYGMHIMSPERFDETVDNIAMNFYRELDKTQRNFYPNSKILLLGGAGSIKSELVEDVNNKNINIVFNSITQFLINLTKEMNPRMEREDYDRMQRFFQHPEISYAGWIHLIDETWNPELINYIHDIWKLKCLLMDTEISGYFYPDLNHPNSDAIIHILDQVCKYIEDLESENGP